MRERKTISYELWRLGIDKSDAACRRAIKNCADNPNMPAFAVIPMAMEQKDVVLEDIYLEGGHLVEPF